MYFNPVVPIYGNADECGIDIQVLDGPPKDSDPGDIVLVFWAMQMGWALPDGTSAGGGHVGLLWQDNPAETRYGRLNFGVYDDYHQRWYYWFTVTASGGSWKPVYDGVTSGTSVSYGAAASAVQTSLRAIPSLASSGVTVTGSGVDGDPYKVTFPLNFTIPSSNLLSFDSTSLTGVSVSESGTATSGSTNTLTDTTKTWNVDQWKGWVIRIVSGTGSGQARVVSTNQANVITTSTNWTTPPNATSHYTIDNAITIVDNYATFRGSLPTDPRLLIVDGGQNSYGYDWNYGDVYRFRIFKSPKQNWTAAELDTGTWMPDAYVGTDQQPEEVAYRLTVQNLTQHEVPFTVRDVLIRGPKDSRPLYGPNAWVEPYTTAAWNSGGDVRFSNLEWDGAHTVTQSQLSYAAAAPLNTNVYLDTDAIRMKMGVTRTNPDGTTITLPDVFWQTPQPNVTPNPVAETPQTTPRPWF